ncbi:MAG: F0F1 ATP synthase subunit A [Gracilibacteraceae bacterium]|jgi:F-type H+-transporting ATPase subunit a|nr:F0F1 ATP synthase subunit A [Gracilibacteraceae bacterium]
MEPIVRWSFLNGTVHIKALIMTWVVLIVLMAFVLLGTRKLTSGKPGKFQNLLEWCVDFVKNLISENMDYKKAAGLLSYLVTLIMFVLFSNLAGLVPNFFAPLFRKIETGAINEVFGVANLQSPTADINVTMGLALMTITIVFAMGIRMKGKKFFKHFLEPFPFFLPIHILDYIAKPMTLAFRLFGNIFAGEVLIVLMLMMAQNMHLGGVLGAFIPMALWLAFSIFIGAIQSFVFTVLTIAYVAQAVAEDH